MLYKATKFTLLFVISKFWVLIYGKMEHYKRAYLEARSKR